MIACRQMLASLLLALAVPAGAASVDAAALATLVFEADTGRVLQAHQANRRLFPASLAKLMTVHLIFDALERGEIRAADEWTVSARAAAQPPTGMGLRAGERISIDDVLLGLVVASANDAALVAAEALAEDERAFAASMNARARELGMQSSEFRNASGLPDPGQRTTARDIALLARSLWLRFPQRRGLFATRAFQRAGRTEQAHNRFLGLYPGALGMKTGFTCRAGFNLVAAARRDGRALIGVVLGAETPGARDRAMRVLLDGAFSLPAPGADATDLDALAGIPGQGQEQPMRPRFVARRCIDPPARGPSGWSIDVGVRPTQAAARALAREFIAARRDALPGGRALVIPRFIGVTLHRAIVTGLSQVRARDACLAFRREGGDCVIFGPEAAQAQLEQVRRVLRQAGGNGERTR